MALWRWSGSPLPPPSLLLKMPQPLIKLTTTLPWAFSVNLLLVLVGAKGGSGVFSAAFWVCHRFPSGVLPQAYLLPCGKNRARCHHSRCVSFGFPAAQAQ